MIRSKFFVYQLNIILASGCSVYALGPTFHIKNNSDEQIQIQFEQPGKSSTLRTIQKHADFAFPSSEEPDINKPTTLNLFFCNKKCAVQEPNKLVVTFSAGKKMYLKWDGKTQTLAPQNGNKLGLTTKGYTTSDAVKTMPGMTTYSGKVLRTGTRETVLTEIEKAKEAQKPTMPSAKPTKKPAQPTQPKPTSMPQPSPDTQNLSEADLAWAQFPEALAIKEKTTTKPGEFNKWEAYSAMLGVNPKATTAEFSKAYKKLSIKWHPDKHAGNRQLASDVQALLNEAYAYLK